MKKSEKTSETVIPAKAGIQDINDFVDFNFLDPGFRRGDEAFFNKLVGGIYPAHGRDESRPYVLSGSVLVLRPILVIGTTTFFFGSST